MEAEDRERRLLLAQATEELRLLFEDDRHRQTDRSLRRGHCLYLMRLICREGNLWSEELKRLAVAPALARKQIDLARLFLGAPRLLQNLCHLDLEVLYKIASLGPAGAAEACPEAAVDGIEFDDAQRCIDPPAPAVLLPCDVLGPPPNGTVAELRTLLSDCNLKRTHTFDLCVQRARMLSDAADRFPGEMASLGLTWHGATRVRRLGSFAKKAPKLVYALRTRVETIGDLYELAHFGAKEVARLYPAAAAEAAAMEDREVERWRGVG